MQVFCSALILFCRRAESGARQESQDWRCLKCSQNPIQELLSLLHTISPQVSQTCRTRIGGNKPLQTVQGGDFLVEAVSLVQQQVSGQARAGSHPLLLQGLWQHPFWNSSCQPGVGSSSKEPPSLLAQWSHFKGDCQ